MTSKRDDRDSMRPASGRPSQSTYNEPPRRGGGYQRQSVAEAAAKSFIRSIASSIGRILVRTITRRMR